MDFEEYVQANYKRLEGQTRELVEDAFKSGQQSKQAEIDGLEKKLKYEKSAYRNIKLQFLNKQHDLDELQAEIEVLKAKIEEVENHAFINYDHERDDDHHSYWSGYNVAMGEFVDIIKGELK